MELDRFQATLHILRIYYLGMRSDILPELSPDILKVALQEAVEIRDKYEMQTHSPDSILRDNIIRSANSLAFLHTDKLY